MANHRYALSQRVYFKENVFGIGNVNTKTFILLLASRRPRAFISGQVVDLSSTLKAANRTEFHHLMPRSFLKASYVGPLSDSILANFAFLSRGDNNEIGGVAPSLYRAKLPSNVDEVLDSAIASPTLFADDYDRFVEERSAQLHDVAKSLCSL